MTLSLIEADAVRILTLQDNYIDLIAGDGGGIVQRANPFRADRVRASLLAEHGFSALVEIVLGQSTRSFLFDFGFSETGAAANAEALKTDLSRVEAVVLSHGHGDHTGGFEALAARIGKAAPLYCHPSVFYAPRFHLLKDGSRYFYPPFTRERVARAGLTVSASREPRTLLNGAALFLGEIPRQTGFEKGAPNARREEDGRECPDPIDDDSAVVMRLKGQGLVVLTGCAHAGIVNTLLYARAVTGEQRLHAVMGGFHLSGPAYADSIAPTVSALRDMRPRYLIPTHCTGRKAVLAFEAALPEAFILNMVGTTLSFVP